MEQRVKAAWGLPGAWVRAWPWPAQAGTEEDEAVWCEGDALQQGTYTSMRNS